MRSSNDRVRRQQQRRASWIAFAVVALTVCCPLLAHASSPKGNTVNNINANTDTNAKTADTPPLGNGEEQYQKALGLLSTLPSAKTLQKADPGPTNRPKSLLASLFPNHQGPIATAIRILGRIEQEVSFLPLRIFKSLNFRRPNPNVRERALNQASAAIELLQEASDRGHLDALYTLAHTSLFPPPGSPMNVKRAYHAFDEHARLTGNSTSQSILAFIHSTGLHGVVPADQAKALLFYTFAALGGDQNAEMALGYRYWSGIGVTEDCLQALDWYENAAERSMAHFLSGPPGGRTLPPTPLKLTDMTGGVFGYGASLASTGPMAARPVIKAAQAVKTGERWDEVIEYWRFHADRGDIEASYRLGKIYYHGGMYNIPGGISAGAEGVAAVPKDFSQSRSYFLKVARKVWPRDSTSNPHASKTSTEIDPTDFYFAVLSAHFLGRMHLRGEGVRQDVKIAKMWFDRASKEGDKESLNALGIIYRDGLLDGKPKEEAAIVHFGRAAAQDLPEALVNMGKNYYEKGNMAFAKTYFDSAIRHGSQFEAYYYAATIHASMARSNAMANPPVNMNMGACPIAVSFYKIVAERGCWKNNILAEAEKYWNSPDPSLREGAIIRWQIAADRGVEVAQNNLAYILEEVAQTQRRNGQIGATVKDPMDDANRTSQDALMYWTRSAAQGDVDAMVKLGDFYYHGWGIDEASSNLRHEKAAGYYQAAIDSHSAIAMWNVGWMYENGIGVPQDFHLAKRYYDLALEHNRGAYFPVVLSLLKLHLRSLWYILRGGKQPNLILWGDDQENEYWWPKLFKWDDDRAVVDSGSRGRPLDVDDEDHIQRARDIRDAAVGIGDEEDPGDDFFDGMTRRRGVGGGAGADEDAFEELEDDWELIILALLAVGIGGLVVLRRYYEQRRLIELERERRRREREQQQQQQNQQQNQGQNQQPYGGGQQQQQNDRIPDEPIGGNPPPPMPGARPEDPLAPHMAMFM